MKIAPCFLVAVMTVCVAANSRSADFEFADPAVFQKLFPPNAKVERFATGFKFVEGPVWIDAEGGYLVFSDIPANELKRWSKADGVKLFRFPSQNANGNTTDLKGRLVTCEHGERRVTITSKKNNVKTIVDEFKKKRLNSPNDVVVKSDGSIWFTDPPYGIKPEQQEQAANNVFRFDPKKEKLTVVIADFDRPNGLCFSPDEKKLYVADSGKPRHIRVFDVQEDGSSVVNGREFCKIDKGGPDGIRCDNEGRIWSSSGDGAQVFDRDGKLLGRILLPEGAANLCFGGDDGKTLFLTARTSLYSVSTLVTGARRP